MAEVLAAGLPNMTAQVADAQALTQFADGSVDCITCCYGYMVCGRLAVHGVQRRERESESESESERSIWGCIAVKVENGSKLKQLLLLRRGRWRTGAS